MIICPHCKNKLLNLSSNLHCTRCAKSFKVKEGIPCFCETDKFYEDKFTHTVGKGFLFYLYNAIISPRWRNTKGALKGAYRILDLGCAGGNILLSKKEHVVGVDLSLTALGQAQKIYSKVVQAQAKNLPFRDNYFDAVVALDLFGHIPQDEKDQVLQEIKRVLRPEGIMVMAIECESENALGKFAHKYPELYQKYFIEADGHHGLETPAATLKRIDKNGLEIVKGKKLYTNPLFYTGEYLKKFDNEYREESFLINLLVKFIKLLHKIKLNLLVDPILEIIGRLLDKIYPLEKASVIFVVAKK